MGIVEEKRFAHDRNAHIGKLEHQAKRRRVIVVGRACERAEVGTVYDSARSGQLLTVYAGPSIAGCCADETFIAGNHAILREIHAIRTGANLRGHHSGWKA